MEKLNLKQVRNIQTSLLNNEIYFDFHKITSFNFAIKDFNFFNHIKNLIYNVCYYFDEEVITNYLNTTTKILKEYKHHYLPIQLWHDMEFLMFVFYNKNLK